MRLFQEKDYITLDFQKGIIEEYKVSEERPTSDSGDIIVELAGRKIENIYDYTYAIDAVKIGQTTSIIVVRDNNKIEMEIVPGSRQ